MLKGKVSNITIEHALNMQKQFDEITSTTGRMGFIHKDGKIYLEIQNK